MKRRALLIIDVLNDFLDPRGALYCGPECRSIIPAIRRLVDQFGARGDLVVYLHDAHRPDDREFERFPPHAVKGSWGGRFVPELTPPPGSLTVEKTRYSAFFKTDLDRVLATFAPDEVWVAGVVTSICVMDTIGDLCNRDYRVMVPREAVADFDAAAHAFALERIRKVYGATLVDHVDSAQDAPQLQARGASHESLSNPGI